VAGEDLLTYSGQAAIAYRDALNQAQNTQNALLRQYGFVAPDASGAYTVEGAQGAFDPNTLFDKATGGIDKAKLENLAKNLQVGGTGRLADISRAGATGEAEAVMEVRQRLGEGIGGGLMAQRRSLAESIAAGQLGAAKSEFLTGLGEAMSPIGSAFQQLQIATAQDKADEEAAKAYAGTLPQEGEQEAAAASAAPSALDKIFSSGGVLPSGSRGAYNKRWNKTENTPKNPKPGQAFTSKSGDRIVYRTAGPKGAGWYKKG